MRLLCPGSFAAALAAVSFAAAPASAQWTNPYSGSSWNNPTSSLIDTMLRGKVTKQALLQPERAKPTGQAPAPPVPRTTYRPSRTRVPEEIAASLFPDQEDQAELTRFLREARATYVAKAAKEGRPNDLGHALVFFVAGNYVIFHGQDVSDAATAALNLQLDRLLRASAVAKADDARKQVLADHFVCATAFALAGYLQGKEKGGAEGERQVALYQALAAQNLKSLLGPEAAQLRLTEVGLRAP